MSDPAADSTTNRPAAPAKPAHRPWLMMRTCPRRQQRQALANDSVSASVRFQSWAGLRKHNHNTSAAATSLTECMPVVKQVTDTATAQP
ncbi:MAG: hypothetical protein IPO19_19640 [Rhodoferax sp.]|nr:hypothetical protein [Rhodoferax sp.]